MKGRDPTRRRRDDLVGGDCHNTRTKISRNKSFNKR